MPLNTTIDCVSVDETTLDRQCVVLVFRLGSVETEIEINSLLESSLNNVPGIANEMFATWKDALGVYRSMACVKIRFIVGGHSVPLGLVHGIMTCVATDQTSRYQR